MATYFFDTSALAERYIQETGSSWVSQICEDEDNNSIFILELTEIELVSAICRRAKGGTLTSDAAQIVIAGLMASFRIDGPGVAGRRL